MHQNTARVFIGPIGIRHQQRNECNGTNTTREHFDITQVQPNLFFAVSRSYHRNYCLCVAILYRIKSNIIYWTDSSSSKSKSCWLQYPIALAVQVVVLVSQRRDDTIIFSASQRDMGKANFRGSSRDLRRRECQHTQPTLISSTESRPGRKTVIMHWYTSHI